MAEKPMRLTTERVRPERMAGKASGRSTFRMTCHDVAPMAWAASTTPRSTSLRAPSTTRPTKGAAAMERGTMAAPVPMDVPAISRVTGISSTMRMMKGVDLAALTTTDSRPFSTRLSRSPPLEVT